MLPSERARVTRRRRIAHLGVGGIIVAAASVKIAAAPEPVAVAAAVPTAAPGHKVLAPAKVHQRAVHHRASRSTVRKPLLAPTHVAVPTPGVWAALAQCEAGGNWADTAGYYEGGLQFASATWLANGGGRYAAHAYDATPAEQITIARRVLHDEGVGAWPICGPRVGLQIGD